MSILSLCIIVKNCAGILDRCLASCNVLFDEIVVVDTGSKDNTQEIAKKYKARLYEFEWVKDFAKARNFSFSKATCPWIMWLDSDDIIETPDLHKLLQLKSELSSSSFNSYMLSYKFNNHISGAVHRIVRKDPKIYWRYPGHETLIIENPIIEKRDITVVHTGEWQADGQIFDILKEAYAGEFANDGRIQHYLAREYYYHHQFKEAITLYRKHLNNIPDYTKLGAYYYYAESCFNEGWDIKALDLCFQAIKKDPKYSDFYCLLGEYYFKKENWEESKKWYNKALSYPYPTDTSEVFMVIGHYGFDPKAKLKIMGLV